MKSVQHVERVARGPLEVFVYKIEISWQFYAKQNVSEWDSCNSVICISFLKLLHLYFLTCF